MHSTDFDQLPGGTEWVRCAFQVNPFPYLAANGKTSSEFPDEATYNNALIDAFKAEGIGAIAITDHWAVSTGEQLRADATAAGITVFPGFEATSKDGVHLLFLFDPDVPAAKVDRFIGACGIAEPANASVVAPTLDAEALLEKSREWGATVIAAHVNTGGGLLDKLSGQSAIKVWRSPHLHAVALGGVELSQGARGIVENKDQAFRRENKVAVLRAADISAPDQVAKPGSSTWVKLSARTANALDLAFRTPETRVSQSAPNADGHPRIIGIAWRGGFLNGATIRLNESLNVLIGGRGTGKSTVIESIRFALGVEPIGETAKREHESTVRSVLGSGTEVEVLVETVSPARTRYTISRVVGSSPTVQDSTGNVLASAPVDVFKEIEVYGQRELAELARDRKRLTELLGHYMPGVLPQHRANTRVEELRKSRESIVAAASELDGLEADAGRLRVVEERIREFDEAGAGEKLAAQSQMQTEQRALEASMRAVADPLIDLSDVLVDVTGIIDSTDGLPQKQLVEDVLSSLSSYNAAVTLAMKQMEESRVAVAAEIAKTVEIWTRSTESSRQQLVETLRELKVVDGQEYLRLQAEREDLKGLPSKVAAVDTRLTTLRQTRANLIAEIDSQRAEDLRELKRAAKKVGKALPGRVMATVDEGTDRRPLLDFIRSLGGRRDSVRTAVENASVLTPAGFAAVCRGGAEAIQVAFPDITAMQRDELANLGEAVFMQIEELEFPVAANLHLNIAAEGKPTWRGLDSLSTGQRATALLLLLLKRGDGPLIIDQPEDDLDNLFINSGIVPELRGKGARQIVFSSHNANIPVLGDADQLIVLNAQERDGEVVGAVADRGLGSIDHPELRTWVEELLEGGKDAFNTRRYLYGF